MPHFPKSLNYETQKEQQNLVKKVLDNKLRSVQKLILHKSSGTVF